LHTIISAKGFRDLLHHSVGELISYLDARFVLFLGLVSPTSLLVLAGFLHVLLPPLLTFTVRVGFERTTLPVHHQENFRYPKALQKLSTSGRNILGRNSNTVRV
jgi:hypothetical protein